MTNPQILEEVSICLTDVKAAIDKIESRNPELGLLSQKTKEYLDAFCKLDSKQKDELLAGLKALNLTRLRDEHIIKILDFLPQTIEQLKVVLQGYNLTLPKKDQTAIIDEVKKVI